MNSGRAVACTCAIVIREGNDVIEVSRCDQNNLKITRKMREQNNKGVSIYLEANGAKATVSINECLLRKKVLTRFIACCLISYAGVIFWKSLINLGYILSI